MRYYGYANFLLDEQGNLPEVNQFVNENSASVTHASTSDFLHIAYPFLMANNLMNEHGLNADDLSLDEANFPGFKDPARVKSLQA